MLVTEETIDMPAIEGGMEERTVGTEEGEDNMLGSTDEIGVKDDIGLFHSC